MGDIVYCIVEGTILFFFFYGIVTNIRDTKAEKKAKKAEEKRRKTEHWPKVADETLNAEVKKLYPMAEAGDAEASYRMYEIFKNIDESYSKVWMMKAAEAGVTEAEMAAASYSFITKKDYDTAVRYYMKLAEKGSPNAQCILGQIYCCMKDYDNPERSFYWHSKAAAQGEVVSQRWMGLFYLQGSGVERDVDLGVEFLKAAAEKGDVIAKKVLDDLEIGRVITIEHSITLGFGW